MTKLMLLGAGLLIGTAVAHAQVDTTRTQQRTTPQQSTPQAEPIPESKDYVKDQPKDQIDTKDMTRVKSSDVPEALRQALQSPEYKGWENGAIYKSKSNSNYTIVINNGGKKETYRFGPDGKPIGDY